MSSKDKKEKRETAIRKLNNQLSVLTHHGLKKHAKVVRQMQELATQLA